MPDFWSKEDIYFHGDSYYTSLLKDIEAASEYISVEMYIFNHDELGLKVTEALIRAHRRGVRVQVMVDGIGSYQFYTELSRRFHEAGISVKLFNPLPFLHPFYGNLSFFRKIQTFATRALRLNQRNHRKIITIDQRILYTGSFNITAEHTTLHAKKAWKDMGARVEGIGVKYGVLNFKRHWKFREYLRYKKQHGKETKVSWKFFPLRLNHTLLMKTYYQNDFVRRINLAEKRIWFISPYFIPKRRVIRALAKAASRGVDVRLLLQAKSDVVIFHSLQYFHYPFLLKSGVKIFHYSDTVLHAKNYIIDDWMTIGSTNLNHRSMLHDLEVDLVIQNENNHQLIRDHFIECERSATQVHEEEMRKRPLMNRVLGQLFFIFRYWF